jgi:hypothetical protein
VDVLWGVGMEINLAIYGGAVAIGALAAVAVQWAYGEWLWRLDRGAVQMPELSDSLLKQATMAALLEMIEYRDRGGDVPPTPDMGPRSSVNEWGQMVQDFEGEDVVS